MKLTLDDLYISYIRVTFTPTVEHCSMATVIGLCIRVKLIRSLPPRYKVIYRCRDCGKEFIIRLFARAIRFLYADIMSCTHVYQVLVICEFFRVPGERFPSLCALQQGTSGFNSVLQQICSKLGLTASHHHTLFIVT